MDGVTVEPATMGDVDVLADLWVSLAAGQRVHGSTLRAESNRSVARDAIARHVVTDGMLVARDPDGILGFVMFAPETGSYDEDVDRGVVRNLFVRPEFRGEGLGGRLLAAAEDALADAGATAVSLEAMADNESARRFYEDAGYREHRVTLEKRLGTGENDTDSREGE